ncbi:MAG: flagellar assembly protein FliW [Clostridiaceae bacterium]|nr:flagellar assembly protein FliW [Clostridiaceae bacterium]
MIFNSMCHGELEYEEKDIVTLNKGLLGFEDLKEYILVDLKDCEPFKLLQSLEKDEVGMIVVSPYDFFEKYKVKLNDETIESLHIEKQEDVLVLTTITLNNDPKKITTNLQGPIIINTSNNLGEQIILDNSKYKVKEPLLRE